MLCKYDEPRDDRDDRDVFVLVHGFDVHLPGRPGESIANLMENGEGGSLVEAIAKGSLDRTAMNNVTISLVMGVMELHSWGIIHGGRVRGRSSMRVRSYSTINR
jgi:hypothetical protein